MKTRLRTNTRQNFLNIIGGSGGASVAYYGYPAIPSLTAIDPQIWVSTLSGPDNLVVTAFASGTTWTGPNSSDFPEPKWFLHYSWDFGDPDSTRTLWDPISGTNISSNTGQTGLAATHVYETAGTYTITLTVTGKDGSGNTITATTTTLKTVGELEVFTGNATGGTYTLNLDVNSGGAQTTASLAYDANDATILAALNGLSNVTSGDILSNRDKRFEFRGALAGQTLSLTIDGTSLTGTSGPGPLIITRVPSASDTEITVEDVSTWLTTESYHDSNYGGENGASDGTIDRPFTTFTELRGEADTGVNGLGGKNVCWVKAGSDYTFTNYIKWGDSETGQQIRKYGTGADPIFRDTGLSGSSSVPSFLQILHGRAPTYTTSHHAVVEIDFRNTVSRHAIWDNTQAVGLATNPYQNTLGVSLIRCNFTKGANSRSPVRSSANSGTPDSTYSFALADCTIPIGAFEVLAGVQCNFASWLTMSGCTVSGNQTASLLNHAVYPKGHNFVAFTHNLFENGLGANYCFNSNSGTEGSRDWVCHANDFGGYPNGTDYSNTDAGGDTTYFYDYIVTRCKSRDQEGFAYAASSLSCQNIIVHSNDIYSDSIVAAAWRADDPNCRGWGWSNRYYGNQPFVRIEQDNWLLDSNELYMYNTIKSCIEYDSSQMDPDTIIARNNNSYAPNVAGSYYDNGTSSYKSLAEWKGLALVEDSETTNNPNWNDPANGDFS